MGLPELDDSRRIIVPLESREPCETVIEQIADIISVLEACSRSILSPVPCVAFEYESDDERKFLESSVGIRVDESVSESGVRLPIPRDDARLLSALSDRTNGVALLAEAYSGGGESSQYHNFVRFFELAFALRNGPQFLDRWISEISACHYAAVFSFASPKYTASGVCPFKA